MSISRHTFQPGGDVSTNPPLIAVLTPAGRGAVATVRLLGDCRLIHASDRLLFHAANGKPLPAQSIGRLVFGRWGIDPGEEVVVCRHSEQVLDIHCHAGRAAVERLCRDLGALGGRRVAWKDLNAEHSGLLDSECLEALTRSTTLQTADRLLEQGSGLLKSAVAGLMETDLENADRRRSAGSVLHSLLRWAEFGRHLTEPWNIVLAGRPNVGKSSLINALVGYRRAIVHEQPGTTRDVVTVETALDGWPVRLADTAGFRVAAEELESAGIERARSRLAQSDCRVLLVDTSRPPTDEDFQLLAEWPEAIVVAHKCDLAGAWGRNHPAGSLRVSSKTREGVDELARMIIGRLIPEVPPSGTPLPVAPRHVELLRQAQQALLQDDASGFRQAIASLLHGRDGAPGTQLGKDRQSLQNRRLPGT